MWPCLGQLSFGIMALWLSLKKGPLLQRGGEPWRNQRFVRAAFLILGLSMTTLSLWGLYLIRQ